MGFPDFNIPATPPGPPFNLLGWGLSWLTNQLKAVASEPITYARAYDSVDCRATLGKKLLKLDDGVGGFQIVWTDMDFLIKTEDLDFGSGWVTPEPGDSIHMQTGPFVQTFEVCRFGGEPAWTWADPHQSIRRIHAKYIDIEAYS